MNTAINGGYFNAFPEPEFYDEKIVGSKPGVDRRTYIAAKVMAGLRAGRQYENAHSAQLAELAVQDADALLAELAK